MWILFSCLISRHSRLSYHFHVGKIRILLIFSWVNDFRKTISTKNNLLGVVVKNVVLQFLWKKNCVVVETCCVLLVFMFPDLVWCWWHITKQIFHAFFFCIISKLFSLDNVAFNSASRCWILISSGWIISDIKQKSTLHKICQNTGFYWRVFSHINFYSPRNYQKSYDFLIV